jgi:hypothetical protein
LDLLWDLLLGSPMVGWLVEQMARWWDLLLDSYWDQLMALLKDSMWDERTEQL